MKLSIIALLSLFIITDGYAQRSRSSSGRSSSRSGSSSSSSSSRSSSSSSSSSSSRSSSGSSSSGRSSSGSSSSGSSSSGSSGRWSSGSTSRTRSNGGYTRNNTSRLRTQGRSTAPDLSSRSSSSRSSRRSSSVSGQVSNMRNYSSGYYRPSVHKRATLRQGSKDYKSYGNKSHYHVTVNNYYVYDSWIYYPSYYTWDDGYYYHNGYHYYVYSGYRHRYAEDDECDYDLINLTDRKAVTNFRELSCKDAYDKCALERDSKNRHESEQKFSCAERVGDQYKNLDIKTLPNFGSNLDEEEREHIKSIIDLNDEAELFKIGKNGYKKCKVVKLKRNKKNCNYQVKVGNSIYPQSDGSVCSNSKTSALYGCNSNSQRENAGCLLTLALVEGYCSEEVQKAQ